MPKFYINKPPYTNYTNYSSNNIRGIINNDIIKIDNSSNITIGNHRINTVLKDTTNKITLDIKKPGSFYFIDNHHITINATDLIKDYHFYIAHIKHEGFEITNIPNSSSNKKSFYHIKVEADNSLKII